MKAIILNHTANQLDVAKFVPEQISKEYIKDYLESLYGYTVDIDYILIPDDEPFGIPVYEAGCCSTSCFIDPKKI